MKKWLLSFIIQLIEIKLNLFYISMFVIKLTLHCLFQIVARQILIQYSVSYIARKSVACDVATSTVLPWSLMADDEIRPSYNFSEGLYKLIVR